MLRTARTVVCAAGMVLITVLVSHAADVNKALSEAEGRKRAAENGLKEIKSKSSQPSDQIQTAYKDAATQQNAWLDAVCQAVDQSAASAPDVSTAAETAATTLVKWVTVRNQALGLPDLTGAIADSVKQSVARDLVDIAGTTWKNSRGADAKKRTSVVASLNERLRWKAFEEIR